MIGNKNKNYFKRLQRRIFGDTFQWRKRKQKILDDEQIVSSNLVGNKLISSFKLFSPEKDSRNKSFRNSLVLKRIFTDSPHTKRFCVIQSFLKMGKWAFGKIPYFFLAACPNRFVWLPMVDHTHVFNIINLFQITFLQIRIVSLSFC